MRNAPPHSIFQGGGKLDGKEISAGNTLGQGKCYWGEPASKVNSKTGASCNKSAGNDQGEAPRQTCHQKFGMAPLSVPPASAFSFPSLSRRHEVQTNPWILSGCDLGA